MRAKPVLGEDRHPKGRDPRGGSVASATRTVPAQPLAPGPPIQKIAFSFAAACDRSVGLKRSFARGIKEKNCDCDIDFHFVELNLNFYLATVPSETRENHGYGNQGGMLN
jgi:hypothetical protein